MGVDLLFEAAQVRLVVETGRRVGREVLSRCCLADEGLGEDGCAAAHDGLADLGDVVVAGGQQALEVGVGPTERLGPEPADREGLAVGRVDEGDRRTSQLLGPLRGLVPRIDP